MKNFIQSAVRIILFLGIISVINSCSKAKDSTPPSLVTASISVITQTSAVSGGNITDDNGSDIAARGVCWGITTTPTIAGTHTTNGTGKGTFTSNISGLTAGTVYYARAYATNSAGTAYGNALTFTTTSGSLASLTTLSVSSITGTTAVSGGDITDDNGSDVTARGVCWGIATNPVITGSHSTDGTGTGAFTSSISGLTAGTVYYVRAYATNNTGTAYGNELTFTTTSLSLASLSTTAASTITRTTAASGGNITDDNGSNITARGICWSTSTNPVVTGSHSTDGTGTGIFTSSLSGLTAGTVYYLRAYATNSAGTAYGNEVSFTTSSASLASLTTTTASTITSTTAVSGGNITDDNGSNITARGICWGTSTNPVVTGSHTTDGTGKGIFTGNISGLTAGTVYYVRAYATNSAGTSYGNQVSFTTGTNEVLIQGNAFSPATITVAAGTTIKWTNKDGVNHTVTSDSGLFDSGTFGNGGTFSRQFNTAGTFPYHCTVHTNMLGTVIVQ